MNNPNLEFISHTPSCEYLFESVASDLTAKGYSIRPLALPNGLATNLQRYARTLEGSAFKKAAIGRDNKTSLNQFVRTDSISWIYGDNEPENEWLGWIESFKQFLNKRLLLGLFSFESHIACYEKGQFYKRHYDAFQGNSNRKLSVVAYLNDNWQLDDGGELVIYESDQDIEGIKVLPRLSTLVTFLSEEFPHEVLPAKKNRLSVSGWFRVNQSIQGCIDPPR